MTPIEIEEAAYEAGYKAGLEAGTPSIDCADLEIDLEDVLRDLDEVRELLEEDAETGEWRQDLIDKITEIHGRVADAAKTAGGG